MILVHFRHRRVWNRVPPRPLYLSWRTVTVTCEYSLQSMLVLRGFPNQTLSLRTGAPPTFRSTHNSGICSAQPKWIRRKVSRSADWRQRGASYCLVTNGTKVSFAISPGVNGSFLSLELAFIKPNCICATSYRAVMLDPSPVPKSTGTHALVLWHVHLHALCPHVPFSPPVCQSVKVLHFNPVPRDPRCLES